jgi:heterogeneous nuclear ribonucleoprotein A1/A3
MGRKRKAAKLNAGPETKSSDVPEPSQSAKVVEEEEPSVKVEEEDPLEIEEEEVEVEESEEGEEEEEEDDDNDDDDDEEEEEEEEEEDDDDDSEEEEEDEGSKSDVLRKLLEPFGKDQIIEFLKDAAAKDQTLLDRLIMSAESDPAHRKIFIHGLGWDATADQVTDALKKYDEIEECKVVSDKLTGRAKGYGFVLFKTRRGAKKSLRQPQKRIGSRMVSLQLASAGPVNQNSFDTSGRKLFVANVGPHLNPDALRALFAKFGELEEGPVGADAATGKFKGFAIFLYKTIEGCNKALEEPVKMFEGVKLQCSLATTKNQNQNQNQIQNQAFSIPSAPALQQPSLNYGINPALYSPALMMSQNPALGLANPMLFSAFNQQQQALAPQPLQPPPVATAPRSYSLNSMSPSVIRSYAPQQGLGPYQGSQMSFPSSSGGSPAPIPTRSQPYPSYMGLGNSSF